MKEYILLLLIAGVGIAGLLTIHFDIKSKQIADNTDKVQSAFANLRKMTDSQQEEFSQLVVKHESTWPEIHLSISHFDYDAEYFLDSEEGSAPLNGPDTTIRLAGSGKSLIKLIKNEVLVDVLELDAGHPISGLDLTQTTNIAP